MILSSTSLLFSTLMLAAASIVDANNRTIVPANFEELLEVPQDVTALRLGSGCSWTSKKIKFPNTMYTIQPAADDDESQSVRVWTYPANLVKAEVDDVNTLQFEWNEEVASAAQEGGVFITFPAAQLNRLAVASGSQAQVLGGFTNIQSLRVSSGATLYATMTQNADALLSLEASSAGSATMVSNVPVKDVSASSSGTVRLQAPGTMDYVKASSAGSIEWQGPGLVTTARVSSGGRIKIDGGSLQDARLSSGSNIFLYNGNFTGHAEASSGAALDIQGGSVASTASFELRSGSTVTAPQCINVVTSSGGQCRSVDSSNPGQQVNVQVSLQPFTATGSGTCGGGYHLFNGIVGSIVGTVIVMGAIIVGLCICRRRRRSARCKPDQTTKESSTTSALPEATVMGYEDTPVMAEVVHSHIDHKDITPEKTPIV